MFNISFKIGIVLKSFEISTFQPNYSIWQKKKGRNGHFVEFFSFIL